jgi:MFS family permease
MAGRAMTTESAAAGDEIDSLRGWLVVGCAFVMLFFTWGSFFTYTVYAGTLGAEFGLTGVRVSGVYSLGVFVLFAAGGLVGIYSSRLPLRPVIAGAGVTIAAAAGLFQVVESFLGVVLAFALLGVAGGTLYVLVASTVPQWFDAYEGRAMGVAVLGNGLSVQVFALVWLGLIERGGIRYAFLVVGGAFAAAMVLASLLFRRPRDRRTETDGNRDDGTDLGSAGESATDGIDRAWLVAFVRTPRFVAAFLGLGLLWAWYYVLSSQMVQVLTTAGVARTVAATAFGLVGGVSVLARVASGVLADRVGARQTLTACVLLAAFAALLLIRASVRPVMYASLVVFGVGLGGIATLYSPVVLRGFGSANAAAVIGVFQFASAISALLTPVAMNALVDAFGGYTEPLVLLAIVTAAGAGLFWSGTEPEPERPPSERRRRA